MGKAVVLQHLGEAEYSVELKFNRDRGERNISRMQERADNLEAEVIPDLQNARDAAELDLNQASADLNAAIDTGTRGGIEAAQKVYISARQAYLKADRELSAAEGEKAGLLKRIQTIRNNLPADKTVSAWCADYVTDLEGEVGTVEVPGERQHVQLRPGYEGRAAFDPSRDGRITPVMSTTPAGAFYNLALLPGWQRWMPQYRLGEIYNINTDTDTCDVTLDSETSSVRGLPVDQDLNLQGVPIEYMNCNSIAFSDGDRVLVEFLDRDFQDPVVIGFESEPGPCATQLPIRCPEQREYKLSPLDAPIEYYLTEDSGVNKLVTFADPDGSAPDGPCETEHDHWEYFAIDGVLNTPPVHVAHSGTEFTFEAYSRSNQIWDFCSRYPGHPICDSGRPRLYAIFKEIVYADWRETLLNVNTEVNENTTYLEDIDETWDIMAVPGGSGDCEDYALTKMQLLADQGLPAGAMDLLLGKLEPDYTPHAVLVVNTDLGVFFLDQAPNEPRNLYKDLVLKTCTSRFPGEIGARRESGDVQITSGGNILVNTTPAEISTRIGDVHCWTIHFFSNYLIALQAELTLYDTEDTVFTVDDFNAAENWIYVADSRAYIIGDQGDEIELINSDANNGTYTIASTEYGPEYQTAKIYLQETLTAPGSGEDIREMRLTNAVLFGEVYSVLYRYVHTGNPGTDYAEIVNYEFVQYLHQDWEWDGSKFVPPEDNGIVLGPFSGIVCDPATGCDNPFQPHPLEAYKRAIGDRGTEPIMLFVGKRDHERGYSFIERRDYSTYSSKRYTTSNARLGDMAIVLDYPENDQDLLDYFENLSFFNDLDPEDAP